MEETNGGMDKEVSEQLDRSPHPLPWTVVMLLLVVGAVVLHSVIVGLFAGISIGYYFGNYQGRLAVLAAWRKQSDIDFQQRMERLQTHQ